MEPNAIDNSDWLSLFWENLKGEYAGLYDTAARAADSVVHNEATAWIGNTIAGGYDAAASVLTAPVRAARSVGSTVRQGMNLAALIGLALLLLFAWALWRWMLRPGAPGPPMMREAIRSAERSRSEQAGLVRDTLGRFVKAST